MSIRVTFDDIKYSVKDKDILKEISGNVDPGEMLTIMGPTGCGKSTLFNVLTNTIKSKVYTGSVKYNGKAFSEEVETEMAYVKQSEIINPLLTVKENLEYAATFRLPEDVRKSRVKRIIDEFHLNECQNTAVGSKAQSVFGKNVAGVSDGERRRAYIA